MTEIDTLRQQEISKKAELRAALLAAGDTATIRAEMRRIQQRITKAIAHAALDEEERGRFNAAAQRQKANDLAADIKASIDAKLAQFKPPAALNEKGLHQ